MNRKLFLGLVSVWLSSFSLEAKPLRVAFVGDPQVDNKTELGYARKSVFRELRERKDLDLVLLLGDLVNNDTSLLPEVKASLDSLPCPWFSVPGNHDRDQYQDGSERDLASWTSIIGYCDTSIVRSGVRFILMNNMQPSGRNDYRVGFSEAQKEYLRSQFELSSSRAEQVLLLTHVPLREAKGLDSLKAVFALCPSLSLVSAHTHKVRRGTLSISEGRKIDDIVVGASCGSWWRGVKDEYGVPLAVQNCGAPRGYFVADFSPKSYKLKYIPLQGERSAYAAYLVGNELVVNVFGGAKAAQIEVRLPGSTWQALSPYSKPEPGIQALIEANQALSREYRRKHKDELIPLRRLASPHCWSLSLSPEQLQKIQLRSEILRSEGAENSAPSTKPARSNIRLRYRDPRCRFTVRELDLRIMDL